jgi:hypothetical protein
MFLTTLTDYFFNWSEWSDVMIDAAADKFQVKVNLSSGKVKYNTSGNFTNYVRLTAENIAQINAFKGKVLKER